jgi:hypothetical protein
VIGRGGPGDFSLAAQPALLGIYPEQTTKAEIDNETTSLSKTRIFPLLIDAVCTYGMADPNVRRSNFESKAEAEAVALPKQV